MHIGNLLLNAIIFGLNFSAATFLTYNFPASIAARILVVLILTTSFLSNAYLLYSSTIIPLVPIIALVLAIFLFALFPALTFLIISKLYTIKSLNKEIVILDNADIDNILNTVMVDNSSVVIYSNGNLVTTTTIKSINIDTSEITLSTTEDIATSIIAYENFFVEVVLNDGAFGFQSVIVSTEPFTLNYSCINETYEDFHNRRRHYRQEFTNIIPTSILIEDNQFSVKTENLSISGLLFTSSDAAIIEFLKENQNNIPIDMLINDSHSNLFIDIVTTKTVNDKNFYGAKFLNSSTTQKKILHAAILNEYAINKFLDE